MKLSVLTPTNGRPEAFALLENWMTQQERQPDQWIVVNDGAPYNYRCRQTVIARQKQPGELHSLCCNVLAALPAVEGDAIVIMEDDDWYHPSYLAVMEAALTKQPIIGIAPARYYNVAHRLARPLHNMGHASLAQTAIADRLAWLLKKTALQGRPFIDLPLWREARKIGGMLLENKAMDGRLLHVGIKGMPGTVGIGNGHKPYGRPDPACAILHEWMGIDANQYKEYRQNAPRST